MPQETGTPKVYTVAQLTEEIQELVEDRFDFLWVEGEISNLSVPASGHYYMMLKDDKARIRAVMFRIQARVLKFVPENGMKVIAQGRLGMYAPRGEIQVILDYLEPMGVGALALAFEQLKRKLGAEGLFDEHTKKPLPYLPQRVAVITSPTGAAVRDFLKVIGRRFANLQVIVVPVRVQGDEAAGEVAEALDFVNERMLADVIVLTRGGGSLEDLWAFNEEEVARAIRRSRIPVVSAVGHEIDVTISDMAADLRAPTPSAAAEMLVVEKEALARRLGELKARSVLLMRRILSGRRQALDRIEKVLKDPRKRLRDTWLRLDEIDARLLRAINGLIRNRKDRFRAGCRALVVQSPSNRMAFLKGSLVFQRRSMETAMRGRLREKQADVSLCARRLEALSPVSVLKRGYSITRRLPGKEILTSASRVDAGDRVQVILHQGELGCLVEKSRSGKEE